MRIVAKTDGDLHQLAEDIVNDKVFTTWLLPEEDIELFSTIFVTFSFMKRRDLQRLRADAGLFYEYRYKAMSEGFNGHPCFLSVQWLTKADTETLKTYVHHLEKEGA